MIVSEADIRLFVGLEGEITSAERGHVQRAHTHAEGLVKSYLGYDPQQRRHVEFYPRQTPVGGMAYQRPDDLWTSNGVSARPLAMGGHYPVNEALQLRHIPVRSITELYDDPGANFGQATRTTFDGSFDFTFQSEGFATESLLTLGDDYFLDLEEQNICWSGHVYRNRGTWGTEVGSIAVNYVAGFSAAELAGRADADAAESDAARGMVTVVGVDASPISYAVMITAAKMLHVQNHLRKSTNGGGFNGGNTFQSERFQDYQYTRPQSDVASTQLTGLIVALPAEAQEALDDFRYYGDLIS